VTDEAKKELLRFTGFELKNAEEELITVISIGLTVDNTVDL